jgi:ADP-ribose pyrophosphatase YjhB (NUDIX family)
MEYREFTEEGTDLSTLVATYSTKETYEIIHKETVILCHDVFIRYQGKGILLVKRLNHPEKDVYWPIGGRILRGMDTQESLKQKARDECSLTLTMIAHLGVARTFFKEEPFGHGKGTDTLNLIYLADGEGELKLNNLHKDPLFITKENYQERRETLPEYVQTYLDEINTKNLW